MIWVKPDLRVPGRLFEELSGRRDDCRSGGVFVTSAGLPAAVGLRVFGVRGSDDVARVGKHRRCAEHQSQSQKHRYGSEPGPRSPTHLDLLPLDHVPTILPDFDDVR